MEIVLRPYQFDFIYSPDRYPAMVTGWGAGKSMCAIMRAMLYSKGIPDNFGMIFRKEYTDLRDSTVRDFEKYTGLKVDHKRSCKVGDSEIVFKHIEEIGADNLKNMNLGWFFIEQAEELDTDNEFFALWGRLRRDLKPSAEFLKLGLPITSGFIIANVAGDNWIKKLWKDNPEKDFELIEATTYDNAENLPKHFLDSLEVLKQKKPDLYKRFVMNDWTVAAEGKVFSRLTQILAGGLEPPRPSWDYIMGVDLAKYKDYTVLMTMSRQGKHVCNFQRFRETSWNLQRLRIKETAKKYHNALVVIDATGVGDPIVEDLTRSGVRCLPVKFTSEVKEQLVEGLVVAVEQALFTMPHIEEVVQEMYDFRVEATKTTGRYRYAAPDGKNDDCVIALALCIHGLSGLVYGRSEQEKQANYTYRHPMKMRRR